MKVSRRPLSQLTLEETLIQNNATQNFDEYIGPRAGTVSRMVLKNFMCHSHLEVTFDHNINFVIGRNGSGKSAILTALVVGLGGKASLTNRGNSIKGFIKAGKNAGSVEVTLRNQGPLAYRYNTFGKEITIIRNFTANGSSSYKIKSANGDIVTNQAKEVQRVCSTLSIQIDNPICLLNQDTSRNFLNSKDSHQKFTLFMRATCLQDLLDEYKKLLGNKKESMRMLREKEVLYEKLQKELEGLQKKVENCKSINKLKERLNELHREFYWAKVRDSEEEMNLQQQVVQQLQEEVASVEEHVASFNDRSSTVNEKMQELQQKVVNLQESIEFQNGPQNALVRTLGNLKDECGTKVREKRIVLKDIAVKTSNSTILEQEIDSLKQSITQVQQEKLQRFQEIQSLEEKLKGIEELFETSKNDQFQIRNSLAHLQEEECNLIREVQQIKSQIDNTTSRLNSFKNESNSLSLYGRDMPRIVEAITASKSKFVHLPRGPLGSYIKLKDKKWAVAVEGFFGASLLRAFAVDNKQDNVLLMSIFQRYWSGGGKPMVITSRFFSKIHDVQPNKVHSIGNTISVYDALEVSDPVVANCLIDQTGLESVLLLPDTDTAIELMSERHRVPRHCKQGITIKGDKYYPDPNYKTYGSRYHTAQFLQVSTADMIKHLNQKLRELTSNKETVSSNHQSIKAEVAEHSQKMNELEVKVTKLNRAQLHIKRQLDDLKGVSEPDVANIHTLENELAEITNILERRQAEQLTIVSAIEEFKRKIEDTESELNKIKNVCRGYEDRIEALQNQIREETTKSKMHQTDKRFAMRRLQEVQTKLRGASKELTAKIDVVVRQSEEANRVGARLVSQREVPIIVREVNVTQRTITQIQSEVESPEELTRKYQNTNEAHKKASEFMKSMCDNVNELQLATEKIMRHYKHTEDYFVSFVKHSFQKVLEFRQFEGNVEIDIAHKKLDLIVIPQQGSQGYTTTSNLSGGERSFSTVAFLYSLWQCMEFPFYFLDEFDVFMDKVNRTKVMEVLLHHAKSCPDSQFVFLTPQDVSHVNDEAVTIHRLEDPERSAINGS